MKKIGVFYGTTSGTTLGVVDELEFYLRKDNYEVYNVADGISSLSEYENLILITPTYGVGELQADWENIFEEFSKIDFSDKVVGIIGLGSQYAFGESFVGGMKVLYDVIINNGGKVVGFTSTEGYHYEESESVIDNKFIGLAIDEGNQGDYTPERIENWVVQIKPEFN